MCMKRKILFAGIVIESIVVLIEIVGMIYIVPGFTSNNAKLKGDQASFVPEPYPAAHQTSPTITQEGADLSYILIISNKNSQILLTDSVQNSLGNSYLLNPVKDPVTGKVSRGVLKELVYKEPLSGEYALTVNDSSPFSVDIYLYDKQGNVLMNTIRSEDGHTLSYRIIFDKDNSKKSSLNSD